MVSEAIVYETRFSAPVFLRKGFFDKHGGE
jgi:hypothetical protein